MPIYDFTCPQCGLRPDMYAQVEEKEKLCPECRSVMKRNFPSSWGVSPDIQPFLDENMGHDPIYIKSRRHQRDELKRRGLVQIG